MPLGKLCLLAVLCAVAAFLPTLDAAAGPPDQVTIFKGRFVCDVAGAQVPLAGALVAIEGRKPPSGLNLLGSDVFTSADPAGADQLAVTGSDGDFQFRVPFSGGGDDTNYFIQLWLDDHAELVVRDYPSPDPVTYATGENQNDVPVQDYHTQLFPGPECGVWLGLRKAISAFDQLRGGVPPLWGTTRVDYGAPSEGDPWANYTTIEWPSGYSVGPDSDHPIAALHELGEVMRNASLGTPARQYDELAAFDFKRRHSPCTVTGPVLAFYEGWAEYWASDFAPAPTGCGGAAETDQSVEGMVAWRLTKMERLCAADSRERMSEILLTQGAAIHTLADLVARLPRCDAGFVDPSQVERYAVGPSVTADARTRELRRLAAAAAQRSATLSNEAEAAKRAAAKASCDAVPCIRAVAAALAPHLLDAQAAQAKLVERTLRAELSPAFERDLAGGSTVAFLQGIRTTPTTLARSLAAIGSAGVDAALRAARPLLARDRSAQAVSLVREVRKLGTTYARARQRGFGLPVGAFEPARQTRQAAMSDYYLKLGDLNGELTTQVNGFTFGAQAANGFRGRTSAYLCSANPTVAKGIVLVPVCAARDAGFEDNGVIVRLTSLAKTVHVHVGASVARPGGFAAELDAFDSSGRPVTQTAALVGSSTNGQGAGPAETLRISVRRPSIAYLQLFVNGELQPGSQLAFDNLEYTGT